MANNIANFNQLVERAMETPGRAKLRPVVEKELLHYDILFALEQAGLLDNLTFQGGTSLRLCYGAHRFSEDLDFTGGPDFKKENLKDIAECLENYLGKRYALDVHVKSPKDVALDPTSSEIKIDKWQISVVTQPARRDMPRQRIKLEVANISSYTKEPRALGRNYEFLPDGYEDVLVNTETLDEIMADKLVSLPACTSHIRYRDIWDLSWLKQQSANINVGLVQRKLEDYNTENYNGLLGDMIQRLPEIIQSDGFKDEMGRFLPEDVWARTMGKEKFYGFLTNAVVRLLQDTKNEIYPAPDATSSPEFRM